MKPFEHNSDIFLAPSISIIVKNSSIMCKTLVATSHKTMDDLSLMFS